MQKVMMGKLNGYFLIKDNNLSEKYNTIWDKVSVDIKKEFETSSRPIFIFWKSFIWDKSK